MKERFCVIRILCLSCLAQNQLKYFHRYKNKLRCLHLWAYPEKTLFGTIQLDSSQTFSHESTEMKRWCITHWGKVFSHWYPRQWDLILWKNILDARIKQAGRKNSGRRRSKEPGKVGGRRRSVLSWKPSEEQVSRRRRNNDRRMATGQGRRVRKKPHPVLATWWSLTDWRGVASKERWVSERKEEWKVQKMGAANTVKSFVANRTWETGQ